MFQRSVFLGIAPLLLAGVVRAETAPLAVARAYIAAVNAGDMAAVDALIASEARRPPRNFCQPDMPDRDCLLSYLKATVVTQHTTLLPVKTSVVADTVKVRLEVRNDLTRAAHVDRFTGADQITVRGGKIVDFAFVPNEHDAQTVKFFKYMRSTLDARPGGGPPPGSLPGDSPEHH